MTHNITKYLSLDSSYRNRTLYPNPNYFEIPFSDSGMKDRFTAVDPISDAVPVTSFTTVFNFSGLGNFLVCTGNVSATPATGLPTNTHNLGNASSSLIVMCTFGVGELSTIYNYYQGAMLFDSTTGGRARITEYTFIGNTPFVTPTLCVGQFKLETTLSSGTFSDGDDVTIANPTDFNTSSVFVPAGVMSQNRYINYYLYNLSTQQYVQITGFNASTKLLTLASSISTWAGVVFCIRKDLPVVGTGLTPVPAGSLSTVLLPLSFANFPLVGGYIRIIGGSGVDPTNIIRINSIVSGTTTEVNLNGSFTALPDNTSIFEFMPFTRDNLSPLVYSGSMLSQQEVSCYEIALVDLVIPNQVLNVANGGFISEHQYVFVELKNVSSSSGALNVIYSNNPNARNMLFKAAVPDVLYPLLTPFVRLLGTTDVTQTIKFKPNDNLLFSVRLPSGEVISSSFADTTSPLAPLDYLQLTAQFSLQKI